MPNGSFRLAGNDIGPGERQTVDIPLPHQPSYTPMSMPVHVVNGKKPGPVLFVSAAIHGDEINGVAIVKELLRSKSLRRLKGTLLCIPIVNVFGFLTHSRYLPDRRDLNRSFPGSTHGSLAARLAHVFGEEIVKRSTYGIDLHTGANHRTNHPHIRANLDDPQTRKLARAFRTPVIINANLKDGSLRQFAAEQGVPTLLYEAGEALRFSTFAIKAGVSGILNVMREVGMLAPSTRRTKSVDVLTAKSSTWVRAPQSGILRLVAREGARVKKTDVLGILSDPMGINEYPVVADTTGIIIGHSNMPIVNEGDALFHIATFADSQTVKGAITAFQQEHIEGLGRGDYSVTDT